MNTLRRGQFRGQETTLKPSCDVLCRINEIPKRRDSRGQCQGPKPGSKPVWGARGSPGGPPWPEGRVLGLLRETGASYLTGPAEQRKARRPYSKELWEDTAGVCVHVCMCACAFVSAHVWVCAHTDREGGAGGRRGEGAMVRTAEMIQAAM